MTNFQLGCLNFRHFPFLKEMGLYFTIHFLISFLPATYALFNGGYMPKQLNLNIYKGQRGGRRPGSGRKRIHSKGVAHRERETVTKKTPLHINFKYRTSIRNKFCLKLLKRAVMNARGFGLRIIHFSLQHNHIHLIVEAQNNEILTTGMKSLTITFAKGLKMGKVQIERYHLHVLRSVRETRNAVMYVLFNKQKHEKGTCSTIDEYCSLLFMTKAAQLLRKFAREKRLSLMVSRVEKWDLDRESSHLLRMATIQLGHK